MAEFDRRHAVTSAALVIGGLPLLAACGAEDETTAGGSAGDDSTGAAPQTGGGESGGASGGGEVVVAAADVPVGGGYIDTDRKIVVTQPTEGEFRGFSAVCTHSGCVVSKVEAEEIVCLCHMSHFSVTDGSVVSGPAEEPLPEVAVTEAGGQVSLS